MTDEVQTTQPNIVEQAKSEREALEKVRDEVRVEREKIEQMRSEQILSGKTDAGRPQEKPKELTAKEYADSISRGIIPQ